jgi:hypothetical protein
MSPCETTQISLSLLLKNTTSSEMTKPHFVRNTSWRTSRSQPTTPHSPSSFIACSTRETREEGKVLYLIHFRETEVLALDCERILTEHGECLARVSIVNYYGNVVFDTLVRPISKVYDYREWITGIKPMDLKHAPTHSKIAPIVRSVIFTCH